MLHAGLDLSRRKIDVCLLSQAGEIVEEWAAPPDADGLRALVRRAGAYALPVRGCDRVDDRRAVVHDELDQLGWEVLIADAAKVKGLAPLACKTDTSRKNTTPPPIDIPAFFRETSCRRLG